MLLYGGRLRTFVHVTKSGWLVLCALLLAGNSLAAQAVFTYRERTAGADIMVHMEEDIVPHGLIIRSSMSDGDYHEVEYDATEATVKYRVVSPSRKTAYSALRKGNVIDVSGVLAGKPFSRTLQIDSHPWYETMEVSLSHYALGGVQQPLLFWVVQPWDANAYLMQAKVEPEQMISVDEARLHAMPVLVSAAGFLSLFWSTLYWYRSTDGLYVRYEGVRGGPGTPLTVVEMIAEP